MKSEFSHSFKLYYKNKKKIEGSYKKKTLSIIRELPLEFSQIKIGVQKLHLLLALIKAGEEHIEEAFGHLILEGLRHLVHLDGLLRGDFCALDQLGHVPLQLGPPQGCLTDVFLKAVNAPCHLNDE